MKLKGKINNISFNLKGDPILSLEIYEKNTLLREYQPLENEELLSIEIKKYREKRSLNANAYCWVLLQKLAEKLNTTKDELYLIMLERYGQFTHIVVKPNVVDKVKEEWRTVRELGEIEVNGKKGIQLQCYFGSSTYDTKEMATLIDGIVSECKELGIETLTLDDLENLKNSWGN